MLFIPNSPYVHHTKFGPNADFRGMRIDNLDNLFSESTVFLIEVKVIYNSISVLGIQHSGSKFS